MISFIEEKSAVVLFVYPPKRCGPCATVSIVAKKRFIPGPQRNRNDGNAASQPRWLRVLSRSCVDNCLLFCVSDFPES
jgi:hypothetical protein